MHEILFQFDEWLAESRPEFARQLNPPAAPSDIAKLRSRFGATLPASYLALVQWHNGQPHDSPTFVRNRRLMSCADSFHTKEILDEHHASGEFESDLWWSPAWLPFVQDGGGNLVVIDTESDDAIIEFWKADEDRPIVASSLQAWFTDLLSEFTSQKWVEFRRAYIEEQSIASQMAWHKVDLVLEEMPSGGLTALKAVKDALNVHLGIGQLLSIVKSGPVLLVEGEYFVHAQAQVASLHKRLDDCCIAVYPTGDHSERLVNT